MRATTRSFPLALAVLAGCAGASQATTTSAAPGRLAEPSAAEMVTLDRFSQCLAGTYPIQMHEFLRLPTLTTTAAAFFSFINHRTRCDFVGKPVNFIFYTGAAARFYLRQANLRVTGRPVAVPAGDPGYSCVLARAPAAVDRLLATTPGTAAYDGPYRQLQPVIRACITDPQSSPSKYFAGAALALFAKRLAAA